MSPLRTPHADPTTQADPTANPAGASLHLALDEAAADLLFRDAHTTYRFTDEPVSDEQLQAVHELIKWAPTALNSQPLRVTLVRSETAREQLIARLAPGNRAKAGSAPLIAILSYDVDFHETLPEVMPTAPSARDGFSAEESRHGFGSFNAALQAGYFLLGVRAAGLAAGPMGGFDKAGVDADFFPHGRQRSILVVNIGHPAADGQFPRNPRLPYDRVVAVA